MSADGVKLSPPRPLVVRFCAPGLGMLEGMTRLIPTAEVGFVGMVRDERTLIATTYAERLPEDLHGRQCYVLDPMLATGAPWPRRCSSWSSAVPTTSPASACWPLRKAFPRSPSCWTDCRCPAPWW